MEETMTGRKGKKLKHGDEWVESKNGKKLNERERGMQC